MTAVASDLRVVVRQHVRQPGFALTVIVTLAITIGATTAVFSVITAMLLRGLPFAAPDRLVWIASVRPDNPTAPFTLPEFMDYRARTRSLSGLAALANWSASLAGEGVTERFTGARMSANAFDVLGVSAAAGRLFTEADDRPDAVAVVVLSYRLWRGRFGGSASIIGKPVRINGELHVIAGVLPAQFPMPVQDLDVVAPLKPEADPLRHVRNSVNFLRFFGRLADGTTPAQAQAELTAICRVLREQFPVEYARKEAVSVTSVHEQLVGNHRSSMLVLFGAVAVVLATALANLVSLSLLRAKRRQAELAMRAAIGASRAQLMRLLIVDAALLTATGTAAGWLMASQAVRAAVTFAPASVPRLGEARLDAGVALFAASVAGAVTILLTVAPLMAATRTNAGDALRAMRGSIGDRWSHRVRNTLVAAEIAAALVLLLATLLLIQNLRQLHSVDPGFTADGVFQARVSVPSRYRSADDLARFYDQLADRLRASAGVERFGVINIAPLTGLLRTVPFSVEGQSTSDRERVTANFRVVSPDYFATVGTRLRGGRLPAETDRADTPPIALISATLADRFFPDGAVGKRLLINDNNAAPRPIEIAGVVDNVRQVALDQSPGLDIYVPLRQIHRDSVGFVRDNQFWLVKTTSPPAAFARTFIGHLQAVDPDAAVSGTVSMQESLNSWLGPRRFNLGLFVAFALTAVLLAVSGLYGLVAYAVGQRSREIGLRMAIGATQSDVVRMILGQAARLGLAGVAAGVAIALVARPLIARLITDTQLDMVMIAGTAIGLIAVALVAAWVPARRAARIDPTLALRAG